MNKPAFLFLLFLVQFQAKSFEDERNMILFEKLHSQNQQLWKFIKNRKKKEAAHTDKFIQPSVLQISHAGYQNSDFSTFQQIRKKSTDSSNYKFSKKKSKIKRSYPDYLKSDPADDDLNLDKTEKTDNPFRPKGWQLSDELDQKLKVSSSSTKKSSESPKLIKKSDRSDVNSPSIVEKSVQRTSSSKPNALQRAWSSLVNITKSMSKPKPLTKESQRRNFKVWSFQIGLRNLINNDSDGFRHDAEVYHQLGYRIDDRQKIFVERKSVTMTGDGFGKVTRSGIGYQHYLKSVNEVSDYYPYFALFYDHWKGNFDNFNGVSLINNKSSRDILTTRLGVEVPLTKTTNLDFYWERGKKFLNFTDTLGSKIEIHARNNLYGMGLSHSF